MRWASAAPTDYGVYILTNVADPGNIFVGQESYLTGKRTCDFTDGGLCADEGGKDVPVTYTLKLGPYTTCGAARAAYDGAAQNPHPAFGGTKVYIFGGSYFIDNQDNWCTPGAVATSPQSNTSSSCDVTVVNPAPSKPGVDPALLDVEVIRADGSTEKAKDGTRLCENDVVRTGALSEVSLTFGGKAEVILQELTEFRIASARLGEAGEIETWLKAGGVIARVERRAVNTTSFRVSAPTMTASVRGTAFSVRYDPATQISAVAVTEDQVEVQPTKVWNFSGQPIPSGDPRLISAPGQIEVGPNGFIGSARPAASPKGRSLLWLVAALIVAALVAGVTLSFYRRRRGHGLP